MSGDRPSGTVTFLFTDLPATSVSDQDAETAAAAVASEASARRGHALSSHESLAFAFSRAVDAVEVAVASQRRASGAGSTTFRMGVHTGEAEDRDGAYGGAAVKRATRLAASAHQGQILASAATSHVLADSELRGVDFVDLGLHRLRGLSRAMAVHQVVAEGLDDNFPPLRGLDLTPHNLPEIATELIGRENEVEALGAAVTERQLVTIVGPGGIGKTRLALEVARSLLDRFHDGVWLCPLAQVGDTAALPHAVSHLLGCRENKSRSTVESIAGFCRRRRLLLVLDNCEHLLDGAADLVEAIAAVAPDVRVLATSREVLGVSTEHAFSLPTLEVAGAGSAAVELFRHLADESMTSRQWLDAEVDVVERICRKLDGLPLAIELAARRASSLPLIEIEEQLEETVRVLAGSRRAIERHRTIEAAIDWSYRPLSERGRVLFERLSVFAATFDIDAAATVGGNEPFTDRLELIETLEDLIAKSLVVAEPDDHGSTYYRLLEPVRQFAASRLDARGAPEETRTAHARYHAAWAYQWGEDWWYATDLGPAMALARHLPDLRAAAKWAVTSEDLDAGMRLVSAFPQALVAFLLFEIGDWGRAVLDLPGADSHELAPRAAMVAFLSETERDDPRSEALAARAESMRHYDRTATPALMRASMMRWLAGRTDEAITILDGMDRTRLGDRVPMTWMRIYYDPTRSDVDHYLDELWRDTALGGSVVETLANAASAHVDLHRGDYAAAADHVRAANASAETIGARFYVHNSLNTLGVAAGAAGTLTASDVALMADSLREQREAGHVLGQWDVLVATVFALANSGRTDLASDILRDVRDTPQGTRFQTTLATELMAGSVTSSNVRGPRDLAGLVDDTLDALDDILDAGSEIATVRIVTLGRFALEVSGEEVPHTAWASKRARQLCKRLVAARGWPVTRDQLIDQLWPDDPAVDRLGARLSVQLSSVRSALGGAIISDRATVRLDLDEVTTDLEELYAATDDEAVIAAYEGEFLPEDQYDDWTMSPRDEARTRFVTAARRLADDAAARGDHDQAAALAHRLIRADRYDEHAHQLLVIALSRNDRTGEARRAHESWSTNLAEIDVAVPTFDDVGETKG